VIKKLGLASAAGAAHDEVHARGLTTEAALSRLEELRAQWPGHIELIDQLRDRYAHRARHDEQHHENGDAAEQELLEHGLIRREVIDAERQAAIGLYERGVIADEVLRRIERWTSTSKSCGWRLSAGSAVLRLTHISQPRIEGRLIHAEHSAEEHVEVHGPRDASVQIPVPLWSVRREQVLDHDVCGRVLPPGFERRRVIEQCQPMALSWSRVGKPVVHSVRTMPLR